MNLGNPVNICIWASGSGTNAENIIKYFHDFENIKVVLILVSHKNAGVIQKAQRNNVPYIVLSKKQLKDSRYIIPILHNHNVFLNVLAGFIWKIPKFLLKIKNQKWINIHPALLPAYGGKGMYGNHVHEKVLENKEKESGITIHEVNEKYDDGNILRQEKVDIAEDETPSSLAEKIHSLEYKYYPKTIENLISEDAQ